jgi:predicted RNA polymerase sigma factor
VQIDEGLQLVERALRMGTRGPLSVAGGDCGPPRHGKNAPKTDWKQIARTLRLLERRTGRPWSR